MMYTNGNQSNFNPNPQFKSNSVFMPQDSYEMNLQNSYDVGYTKGYYKGMNEATDYIRSQIPKGGMYTKHQMKAYGFGCIFGTLAVVVGVKVVKGMIEQNKLRKKTDSYFTVNNDSEKEKKEDDIFD